MNKTALANTGIQVSPLGLGTVKFGRNQGVKYPHGFTLPSDRDIEQLLAIAAEAGINLLDTAPAYGLSEQRLGELLPNRQAWVIETKVGETFVDGQSYFDFSTTATERSIERSLRHLDTDYLDVVLIHSNGEDERILREEGVLDRLLAYKAAGVIRAVGISSKTVAGGLLALELGCDVVMAAYNPNYVAELPVLEAAAAQNCSIFIKKALASGHLDQLQQSPGVDPIAQTLAFIFAQPAVTSVILGTINPEHLRANVQATERILAL